MFGRPDPISGGNLMKQHLLQRCRSGQTKELAAEIERPGFTETILLRESMVTDFSYGLRREIFTLQAMTAAAAKEGHAETVEFLLGFALKHQVPMIDVLTRETVSDALETEPVPVLTKMEAFDPAVLTRPLAMGSQLLSHASHGGPNKESLYRKTYVELTEYLLNKGHDSNMMADPRGENPGYLLHMATWQADTRIVAALLKHGAVIKGSRAVRLAAKRGRVDVLELFMKHGGDINEYTAETDIWGPSGTPLHTAMFHKQTEAIKWLLEHGADESKRNEEGKLAHDYKQLQGPGK